MAKKTETTPAQPALATRQSMLDLLMAARRVSVPLVGVQTVDQMATATLIAEKQEDAHPVLQWDAVRGVTGVNKAGEKAMLEAKIKPEDTIGFVEAMMAAHRLPKLSLLLVHNAHRQLQSMEPGATASAVQALANLRDSYKRNFRMVVLLQPHVVLPTELEQDVVVLDHSLPGMDELGKIVVGLHEAGELKAPSQDVVSRAVDAVSGLSAFSAEQVVAMSLTEDGLNIDALWERKRVAIEQTPGLSVYRGTQRFDDLRGLDSVKARLRSHVNAKTPVGVVVWIDEGADVFQNVDSDTSGNKTDQQRALLTEMEQNNWRGSIFVGVPGAAKSALAGAFGNEAGVPTIAIDFGAMESKWQGESEQQLRQAIKVIKAVGRGHAFFVLTANSLRGIRPQFQRRFKRGIFFFDLPNKVERDAIWQLYLKKYEFKATEPRPDDDGWTGAEIRECCESAWDTGVSLLEAARYIVPVSRSRGPEIEVMRREAHERFLSAGEFGTYKYAPEPMAEQLSTLQRGIAKVGEGFLDTSGMRKPQ